MNSAKPDEPKTPEWKPTFVLWFFLSLAAGVVGSVVSTYFSVPVYVGGLFAWVLTGLTGTFVLAARIAGR